jgi:zinc protease
VEREQLLLAWPAPAVGQPNDAELDVAAFTLNTAFLRRVLIEETPMAISARAHHFSGLQGGMFFIEIVLRPGWTAEAALQTVDKQLRLLKDFRVRRSWSLFASQSVLTEVLGGAQTTAGRAEKLNRYGVLMHKPGYLADEVARFDQIGPADVLDAIWQYLPDDNRVVALVHADRSAPIGGRLVEKP